MSTTTEKMRGVSAINGSTKARLERAALTLFSKQGIDGTSTKEISEHSGLSEGAIYRHFKSKDELARSIMLAIHNRLTELIKVAADRNHGLPDQVDFLVRHYCRIADDDWDLFKYHILHLHNFPNLSETRSDSPLGAAANLLKAAMFRGDIRDENPFIMAAMSLGTVQQTAQAKVFGYLEGPLSAHTELFTRSVLGVLGYELEN